MKIEAEVASSHIEVNVDLDDHVEFYDVKLEDGDADLVDIECTPDGRITVIIDGCVVTQEEYDLIQAYNLVNEEN